MKTKTAMQLMGACLLATVSAASFAAPISVSFGDSKKFWDTWSSSDAGDNSSDVIGSPDIGGGSATFDGGKLTSVAIGYDNKSGPNSYNLFAGDLFINADADGDWDYVVAASTGNIYSFNNNFTIAKSFNDSLYKLSIPQSGFNIRNDHPIAYNTASNLGTVIGTATVSPFSTAFGIHTINFSGLNLNLGSNPVAIGWALSCANDVLYEQVTPPAVPEPASLLLLGSGLAGLAASRKKARKAQTTA